MVPLKLLAAKFVQLTRKAWLYQISTIHQVHYQKIKNKTIYQVDHMVVRSGDSRCLGKTIFSILKYLKMYNYCDLYGRKYAYQ